MEKTYQHLQPEERITLASLEVQDDSIRALGAFMEHSPSTISRELAGGKDRRGQIPEMVSIHVRPPEVNVLSLKIA